MQIKNLLSQETSLQIGRSFIGNDCFVDSIAQCLEENKIEIPGNKDHPGYKKLRVLCKQYMKSKKNTNWFKEKMDHYKDNNATFFACLAQIQYTQTEIENMKKENPTLKKWAATPGRPDIEGRMICHILSDHTKQLIKIHMIELTDDEENSAYQIAHWIIDQDGEKTVADKDINYDDTNTIHILNHLSQFAPLFKFPVQSLQQNTTFRMVNTGSQL